MDTTDALQSQINNRCAKRQDTAADVFTLRARDMSSEIKKDRVFGNFKKRGYDRPPKTNAQNYKSRPGMSPAHLDRIRQCPCCVCLATTRSDPHHLKAGIKERGMGLRSTDRHTVPMCRHHHEEVEAAGSRNEQRWFTSRGIDALDLAAALWQSSDVNLMTKIVKAHKELS